ncbi:MAG: menaquinone biosynthesis decarboxylase [Bacteroidales bacterium]|nr:menaquinone biosynthesis decarboxylase [Bacteroidales bacterium]
MPFQNLSSFITSLRHCGELLETDEPLSIDQEVACLAARACHLPNGGPAVLVKNPIGMDGQPCGVPILMNALGSEKRIGMMAGTKDFNGLETRLSELLETLQTPRKSLIDKLKVLPTLKELSGYFPKYVSSGPCQEVVLRGDKADLNGIPILKTWPKDGGQFVTLPLVFTESPADGKRNCGMYRIQQFESRLAGFHVHTHHTAAEHMREAKRKGDNKIPAAICIGGEPALTFSAVVPLPPGLDEMILAGFLQGRPVKMVKCKTVPLHVPASCDYVIEGHIHIDELKREGPFGDHTGFYSLADDYPTFHVSAITRRAKPTYLATVVGPPPQEDAWMARAIERLFLPILQQTIPEVLDYCLPFCGVAHNLMMVKIRKSYPGQARKVAHAIWGLGQAAFTKVIVIVDQNGPDIHDESAVAKYFLERLDVRSSIEFVIGPTETLDHATRALHLGSKMVIDLSTPMPGDVGTDSQGTGITALSGVDVSTLEPAGAFVPQNELDALADDVSTRHWYEADGAVLVLEVEKSEGFQARKISARFFELAAERRLPIVVVLEAGLVEPNQLEVLVWATLANIDPERDMLFNERAETVNERVVLTRQQGQLVIDAMSKDARDGFQRDWPTVQKHAPEVLEKIAKVFEANGLKMPTGL